MGACSARLVRAYSDSVELHAAGLFRSTPEMPAGPSWKPRPVPARTASPGPRTSSLLSSELTLEGAADAGPGYPRELDPFRTAQLLGPGFGWIHPFVCDDLSKYLPVSNSAPKTLLRLIFSRSNDSMSYTLPAGYDSGPYAVGPYSLEDRALTAGLNWETQGR